MIATKNGVKAVFQCKRYAAKVGTAAVQQAYAARAFYTAGFAAAVAPVGFTSGAARLAATTGVHLFLPDQLAIADRLMGIPGEHRVERVCPACAATLRVPFGRWGMIVCPVCTRRFVAMTVWR